MSASDGILNRGPVIKLDPIKERELYKKLDEMSSSRKLGDLVTHLIRLAFESPEVFGSGKEVSELIAKMNSLGMTPTRYEYFKQMAKEVEKLRERVDKIYEMAYKIYLLSLMNKYMGLESKADNSLKAAFILERQIDQMCTTLGISDMNHIFASNKLETTHEKADAAFEYIIESYDGIIKEIKAEISQPVSISNVVVDQPISNSSNGEATDMIQTQKDVENTDDDYIELVEKPDDTNSNGPTEHKLEDLTDEKLGRLSSWSDLLD